MDNNCPCLSPAVSGISNLYLYMQELPRRCSVSYAACIATANTPTPEAPSAGLVSASRRQIHEGAYLQAVGNLASTSTSSLRLSSSPYSCVCLSVSSFLDFFLFSPMLYERPSGRQTALFFSFSPLLLVLAMQAPPARCIAVSSFVLGLLVLRIISCLCFRPIKPLYPFHSPHFIPGRSPSSRFRSLLPCSTSSFSLGDFMLPRKLCHIEASNLMRLAVPPIPILFSLSHGKLVIRRRNLGY